MTRRIVVVSGGLRQPSSTRLLADRLAASVRRQVAAVGEPPDIDVVELREHARDIAGALVTGFPTGALSDAVRRVTSAEALVAVTPIFSASYSGLFKSFFDVLEPKALAGMPVLLGATGGTERHSLALEYAVRPLFVYLGAVPVATAVYAATSDWGVDADATARLGRRIDRGAGELADILLGRTVVRATPLDPDADLTPFSDLLAGG